ncbi:MAG: OmpP1/FadL family transporter [Polyangiaceae bacterium]
MSRLSLRQRVLVAALTVGPALGAAEEAHASPLFELVGGTTGAGGFNGRVTGADAPSTYFNPALLGYAKKGFTLGVLVLSDQTEITYDGRTGGTVPLAVGNRNIVDAGGNPIPNDTVPTGWLEEGCTDSICTPAFGPRPRGQGRDVGVTRSYTILGLVSPIVDRRFVLGLHALIPNGEFTTAQAFYNDEREQFFSNSLHPELYSDRLTATSLAFGAGGQITDELAVGLSFTLSLTNTANAGTYVRDPADYDQLLLSTDVKVNTAVSPHFGVVWKPSDRFSLAGTVHSEQKLVIETAFSAALPAGQESDTTRKAVHDFVPWSFGLGSEVGLTDDTSLVGGVSYTLWSDYIDRHGQVPGDVYGDDYAWKNTFAFTFGARQHIDNVTAFIDLGYTPTPVPEQTGRSNYVDNDRLSATAGANFEFEAFGLRFRPEFQIQGHHLLDRYQKKDDSKLRDEVPDDSVVASTGNPLPGREGLQTNNPGWPGFSSGGWLYGGAASLTLLY